MGTGEADDVVSGRSRDRQRAVLMSATGQLRGRLRAVSRGRRHTFECRLQGVAPRDGRRLLSAARLDAHEGLPLPEVAQLRSRQPASTPRSC